MAAPFRIIVCGEGGQGVLSIAKIIATVAWRQGKKATYMPYFTTEKQGGVSIGFAQIGDTPIPFPKFDQADMAVALSQRALERLRPYLKKDTIIIANSYLVRDLNSVAAWKPKAVDAMAVARDRLKKPRTFNMVIMGAMLRYLPGLTQEGFAGALEKTFKDKYVRDPELKALNEQAFKAGFESAV